MPKLELFDKNGTKLELEVLRITKRPQNVNMVTDFVCATFG